MMRFLLLQFLGDYAAGQSHYHHIPAGVAVLAVGSMFALPMILPFLLAWWEYRRNERDGVTTRQCLE